MDWAHGDFFISHRSGGLVSINSCRFEQGPGPGETEIFIKTNLITAQEIWLVFTYVFGIGLRQFADLNKARALERKKDLYKQMKSTTAQEDW